MKQSLELLAPARDAEVAFAAIDCGADAVYMGGPHHGARAAATNTIDDIRRVCDYAHQFRVKVYVTFNTLIYNSELEDARQAIADLYAAGVDALIVQDMGLLRMDIPPIALHASTQCDARTPEKVAFLAQCGMSCIVLPREMSVADIAHIHRTVPHTRLEAFVHGALCVSYSGDCRASLVNGGRSANRGECAQICRMPYNLCDDKGNILVAERHFLSLRDMNRLSLLAELADAGVSSFKIEGRLKDKQYVMNVVTAYSQALDNLIATNPDKYVRASTGTVSGAVNPDLTRTFNRGYTDYFATRQHAQRGGATLNLGSMRTPKFIGPKVATVISAKGKDIHIRANKPIANGDGLTFFDNHDHFNGFRVNKVSGNTISTVSPVAISPGTTLYRNADKAFADAIEASHPTRIINVSMTLWQTDNGIALAVTDSRGCSAAATVECSITPAQKPQQLHRRDTLAKLGGTIYALTDVTDTLGNVFIPISTIAQLRREAIEALNTAAAATYPFDYRRAEKTDAPLWTSQLTFHDNVANTLAHKFYTDHGVTDIQPAMECTPPTPGTSVTVMTCRYCLRHEMGACLLTPNADKLPRKLVLQPLNSAMHPMHLSFDCDKCLMNVSVDLNGVLES